MMQSAQNWRCDDPPASLDSASSRCVPGAMPPQDRLLLHHLGQVKQIRPGPRDPHQQRPVTPDILCELQPVRFPEDERFIPQAFMPVDDRKLAIWFQCPCDSLREPSAVRYAMKRICHKNKIRGSSQFGNVVSVTRDKVAISSPALDETVPRNFQQRWIEVDCGNLSGDFCYLQGEPTIARA